MWPSPVHPLVVKLVRDLKTAVVVLTKRWVQFEHELERQPPLHQVPSKSAGSLCWQPQPPLSSRNTNDFAHKFIRDS